MPGGGGRDAYEVPRAPEDEAVGLPRDDDGDARGDLSGRAAERQVRPAVGSDGVLHVGARRHEDNRPADNVRHREQMEARARVHVGVEGGRGNNLRLEILRGDVRERREVPGLVAAQLLGDLLAEQGVPGLLAVAGAGDRVRQAVAVAGDADRNESPGPAARRVDLRERIGEELLRGRVRRQTR